MGNLDRRLAALEKASAPGLSPRVRQWLGQPLSDAEQRQLQDEAGIDAEFDEVDWSGASPELKAWLAMPPFKEGTE